MRESVYYKQAELLLRILPIINAEVDFALKGGTAINFFIRDMPRLSVDIDLTYLQMNEREAALEGISKSLLSISGKIRKMFPDSQISSKKIRPADSLSGLIVRRGDATIKIEPNLILRGFIFAPQVRSLSKKAQGMFETAVSMKILSEAELYGGKICAALDRQHPRDLFDIKILLDSERFNEQTKKAFIVHLISHPRPMVELLNPNFVDTRDIYEKDLKNMVLENVEYEELVETRNRLVQVIINSLTTEDKNFILSVKRGEPAWSLLGLAGVENLPAVKWKILNIKNIHPTKHKKAFEKLRAFLAG
ncbi:MAG: nucleotidyl transferase AbiEii/AbiGii toxin family protein [Smithella sp.]